MRDRACLGAFEKIAACAGGAGVLGCFGLNPGGGEVLLPRPFGERAGVRGLGVGDAAGRDVRPAAQSLSFVSPKESNQRKSDPTGCVPPLRCGQPAVLADGVRCGTRCALTRFAQTTAASQITKRVHPSVHPLTPPAALLGASRGEVKSPRAITALGLDDRVWERACPRWGLCSSDALIAGKPASTRREQNPGPSAAMARVVVSLPSGCAEERSGRGERVHRRMHPHRDLTRWRCLNGALQARSEFDSAPRP